VSLLTAGLGVATHTVPGIDAWAEGRSLWFGAAIAAVTGGSYLIGQRLARGHPRPVGAGAFTAAAPAER
jgi:hypothetical protein